MQAAQMMVEMRKLHRGPRGDIKINLAEAALRCHKQCGNGKLCIGSKGGRGINLAAAVWHHK